MASNKPNRFEVVLLWIAVFAFVVVFWAAVCLGPPRVREFLASVIVMLTNALGMKGG